MFRRAFVLTVVVLALLVFAVPAMASGASFTFAPPDPYMLEIVQFTDLSTPGTIQTWAWDFGDGATSTLQSPGHQYAADGDYTVRLLVTWLDASTAQDSQVVSVRSHDVMVGKIAAPKPAKVGRSGFIKISIRSLRYAETVQVDVLKSVDGGAFQSVGTLTLPVGTKNSGTDFEFAYTYAESDRGSVVFNAVATIQGARDHVPSNNELSASPLTVK